MGELRVGVLLDVGLQLLPVRGISTNGLAVRADGQQPLEPLDVRQRLLQPLRRRLEVNTMPFDRSRTRLHDDFEARGPLVKLGCTGAVPHQRDAHEREGDASPERLRLVIRGVDDESRGRRASAVPPRSG